MVPLPQNCLIQFHSTGMLLATVEHPPQRLKPPGLGSGGLYSCLLVRHLSRCMSGWKTSGKLYRGRHAAVLHGPGGVSSSQLRQAPSVLEGASRQKNAGRLEQSIHACVTWTFFGRMFDRFFRIPGWSKPMLFTP